MEQFVLWATGHPVAHLESAYSAWQHQQIEIDRLRAEVMDLRSQAEHLKQKRFEGKARVYSIK